MDVHIKQKAVTEIEVVDSSAHRLQFIIKKILNRQPLKID